MNENVKKCLYCQSENLDSDINCQHCGMALRKRLVNNT